MNVKPQFRYLFSVFLISTVMGACGSKNSGGAVSGPITRQVPDSSMTSPLNTDFSASSSNTANPADSGGPKSQPVNPSTLTFPATVPDTPLQKLLAQQLADPTTPLALGNDQNLLRGASDDIKAKINFEAIRAEVFERINQDRNSAGLKPVLYDRQSEQAANLHVIEQLDAQHWLSHFSLNGDMPYMRFSRVNGYDYNEENAAQMNNLLNGNSTSDPKIEACSGVKTWEPLTADTAQVKIAQVALALECAMVSEAPPDDGHRKTILNVNATSVGISVGVGVWSMPDSQGGGSSIRYSVFLVEEFESRGLTSASTVPLSISKGSTKPVTFSGEFMQGLQFDSARLFFEQRVPKSPEQASSVLHYSLPDTFEFLMPAPKAGNKWTVPAGAVGETKVNVTLKDNQFQIPIQFDKGPGVYTILVIGKKPGQTSIIPVAQRSIYVMP